LLLFGAAIAPRLFTPIPAIEYIFVFLATFAVRPLMVYATLAWSGMRDSEKWLTGWFGPKGFASVVYGLLILNAGFNHVAHLIAVAVAASIVMFSSTDILIGRWFEKHHAVRAEQRNLPADERAA
jgi:sodium/hydrogen antiporter